jgi:undecaprenyl-diphosphatase
MVPGVSRSAATIIGGLTQNLTRTAAAEFSFFLAVPTMFAATAYKMLKFQKEVGFTLENIPVLLVGNAIAFVVAMVAIKSFITFLTKHGFEMFGWYRIALGAIILILYSLGYQLQIV